MLTKILREVDEKLKSLEPGKVLDVSNLSSEDVEGVSSFYGENYVIKGPLKDNSGKYVLGIIKPYDGGFQNA